MGFRGPKAHPNRPLTAMVCPTGRLRVARGVHEDPGTDRSVRGGAQNTRALGQSSQAPNQAQRRGANLGPACTISSGQPSVMSLKFSMKRAARAWYLRSYSSRLGQVLAGSRIFDGMPSHSVGTSNPKTGSGRYGTFVSLPERAAFRSARVCRMLMRLPRPNDPPVHPVFTSQQVAPYFSSRAFNISA